MTGQSAAPRSTPFARLARLVRFAGHFARVHGEAAWMFPRRSARERRWLVAGWAARTLEVLNVRLLVRGDVPWRDAPILIVANHISWLDVHALSAVTGARFVAKSEVRGWPLVGALAVRCGTFFIARGSCRAAWRTKNEIATALQHGDPVVIFPEGTTTDGRRVRPFYPALLQAAVDSRCVVHPVTIRYQTASGSGNEAAAFLGDMSFARSLLRVLREPVMTVEVTFGRPIAARNRTRRELAALAQLTITETLALPPPARPVLESSRGVDSSRSRPRIGLPPSRAVATT